MATEYFTLSGSPGTGAQGASSPMRAEFAAIEAGFAKLPTLASNGNKLVLVNAGGTALTVSSHAVTLPGAAATLAALNIEDQTLTGGVIVTSKDLGTISSGTVTPDPGDRPQQHYVNGGAHTLAPSANAGSCLVDITNNASAGAITTSGFTKVSGDAFTTTNGHKFRCGISVGNGGSLLQVQALQ